MGRTSGRIQTTAVGFIIYLCWTRVRINRKYSILIFQLRCVKRWAASRELVLPGKVHISLRKPNNFHGLQETSMNALLSIKQHTEQLKGLINKFTCQRPKDRFSGVAACIFVFYDRPSVFRATDLLTKCTTTVCLVWFKSVLINILAMKIQK